MTLSPDRARIVIHEQSQFPYWGNYQKFMTPDEIAYVRQLFLNDSNGRVSFASVVHGIARRDMFEAPPDFDPKDAEIARDRLEIWNRRQGPRVGDWIDMLDGTQRRFTHDWGDGLQTTGKGEFATNASFHFYGECMSFSGTLDRTIPRSQIVETAETRNGRAWFFHHGQVGAHRGVYFSVPCRVFRQVA